MIISILNNFRINKGISFFLLAAAVNLFLFLGRSEVRAEMEEKEAKANLICGQNNPFGVLEFLHWNHSWNNYKYSQSKDWEKSIALMKEAGVGCVRVDFLWQDIEGERGCFDFTKYDYIVDLLSLNNIEILGILNYNVSWNSLCQQWNCPPDTDAFVNYATIVAKRYKNRIRYWEVWNEPDSCTYWSDQDGLKSYVALLKKVYKALKEIDPNIKVLNGGIANGPASINRLYENGAKDFFDILNVHIFQDPLNRGAIKAVKSYIKLTAKIMARNNDAEKKIWITEIGCPGVKKFSRVRNWWMGKNPSEHKQAEWVTTVYTELLKDKRIEKIFWAFFRDCKEHWDNGTDYFGLIRWNFSKKASFYSYRKCYLEWKKRVCERE